MHMHTQPSLHDYWFIGHYIMVQRWQKHNLWWWWKITLYQCYSDIIVHEHLLYYSDSVSTILFLKKKN